MIQNPVCTFKTLYDIFGADTEITVIRLNDGKLLYKGDLDRSLRDLEVEYENLVIAYSGVYNNRSTGTLDIEVWDLTILEDPDL